MSDSSPAPRPISVLVVEDVADTADTLAEYLQRSRGFDVAVAYDGETGLKRAVADRPDAVVCDVGLPRLDGIRLARQLREQVSPAPLLIAVTAYGGTFRRNDVLSVFDHYLVKPADPNEIAALIESVRGSRVGRL